MKKTNFLKWTFAAFLSIGSCSSIAQTTYNHTGAMQTYVVPPNITLINIQTWGGQGGDVNELYVPQSGGLGGYSTGDLIVTPGESIYVYVGGEGSGGIGGFNGGGNAGTSTAGSGGTGGPAGAGGGASDVRQGGTTLNDRVIVAAGAGGAGRDYVNGSCIPCGTGGHGGHGGGTTGNNGTDAGYTNNINYGNPSSGANAASQSSGGAGGTGSDSNPGESGSLGQGGNGVNGFQDVASGGGGGGYYGGGSGAGANNGSGKAGGGGAGGSSFIGGVTSATTTIGVNTGHGIIIITELCSALTTTVSSTTLCDGDLLNLSAVSTTGGTVTWDNGVIDGLDFIPSSTGIITYTAISDNNADCPFYINVTVNTLPTVTASIDNNNFCEGTTQVTLTGGGASTYSWNNGAINGTSFTPINGTTTYTVTGTDANNCINTETIDITVNPLPTVTASTDNNDFCEGTEQVTLSGGGATTYSWDNTAVDGMAFNPAIGTTTYTVTGTDLNNCINTETIDITVYALPTVTTSTDNNNFCEGTAQVTLTGGGAITYTWDNGITDGIAFDPTNGTTTYTVTGTDVNSCINTETLDITVLALPTVTATTDNNNFCEGTQLVTLTGGGATTYTWDNGITDGVAFNPANGTTTYTVTGTDVNNCMNTEIIDITVNTLPTVTASTDNNDFCEGSTQVILTGGGATTYIWDNGITDGIAFDPANGTTTYTVTGIDANNCVNTETIGITVFALPTVIASTDNNDFCEGTTQVILTGGGATTYIWDNGITDGVAFDPANGTTTYIVTGTDINNCMNTESIDITIIALPIITVTTNLVNYCVGDSVMLTGSGANSYIWDNSVIDNILFYQTSGTVTYNVTGTSSNGCSNTASVNITVNENPTITLTAQDELFGNDGSINLVVNTGVSPYTFDWNNDGTGDNDDNQDLTGVSFGTYTVVMTDDNGCSVIDSSIVNSQLSIHETGKLNVSVYPNPTTSSLTIENKGQFTYTLVDLKY
jgi:hypothetical protein